MIDTNLIKDDPQAVFKSLESRNYNFEIDLYDITSLEAKGNSTLNAIFAIRSVPPLSLFALFSVHIAISSLSMNNCFERPKRFSKSTMKLIRTIDLEKSEIFLELLRRKNQFTDWR